MHAIQPEEDRPLRMSEADYLAATDTQEFKYEYRRGYIYAISGGSIRHGVVTMNIGTHLNNQLGERDCSVTSPDVRVHIPSKETYRYPDVTMFCGDPAYLQGRSDTITNPVLLVEVLSNTSSIRDYNEKLEEYTQIDTLQAYLIISQDTAKVEVYQWHKGTQWLYEYARGLDASIQVPVPDGDITLSLAQIYRRVRWDEDENEGDGASEKPSP